MTTTSSAYIAATATLTAPLYAAHEAVEVFYPQERVPRKAHKMARLLGKHVEIQNRAMVIDVTAFPEKHLSSLEHTPKNWGMALLEGVSESIDRSDIGFISLAYNVTSHKDVLPNLACQIAMDAGLELDEMPVELPYYGCASGIFAINEAVDYCQTHRRAAFVYVFDQCTWFSNPIHDVDDLNFKSCLRSHLLFSDGGVGLLVIPELMRDKYSHHLIKVLDVDKKFRLGNVITMEKETFLVGDGVSDTMPALTCELSIKPLLQRHELKPRAIAEWCIHQGGIPVLDAFKEENILGLSDAQIERSKELFRQYGNFSSPSCLYVLDSFLRDQQKDQAAGQAYGLITGFGAGYYLASLLYQWD